jgi:hypothetical protein
MSSVSGVTDLALPVGSSSVWSPEVTGQFVAYVRKCVIRHNEHRHFWHISLRDCCTCTSAFVSQPQWLTQGRQSVNRSHSRLMSHTVFFPHERNKTFRSRRVSTDTSYNSDPADIWAGVSEKSFAKKLTSHRTAKINIQAKHTPLIR